MSGLCSANIKIINAAVSNKKYCGQTARNPEEILLARRYYTTVQSGAVVI